MTKQPITWGAWDQATRNDPFPLFESTRAACPVQRVRLADGHDAWLVLGHAAALQALRDGRLSKDIVAALDHPLPFRVICELLGVPEDDRLLLHQSFRTLFRPWGAANRDPQAYDHPATLDLGRDAHTHLGFGHGIHFCLGAPLARLEVRIAFRSLLERFPDLHLAVDRHGLQWSHGDGLVLRGLDTLPVRLGPSTSR